MRTGTRTEKEDFRPGEAFPDFIAFPIPNVAVRIYGVFMI